MLDYHLVLGASAIVFGLVGQVLYLKDILQGSIKPHPFSWLGWASLDVVIFSAQITGGGGPGSWVTGVAVLANTTIAVLSLKRGERRINWADWACFFGAVLGITLWKLTADSLGAVIIISVVNFIAFIPTFRKAYLRPNEEALNVFAFDIIKFILSIAALGVLSPTTALFPASAMFSNVIFISMILIRRRQIRV